jgi:hypothetical protein
MQINTPEQLAEARQIVLDMKKKTNNPYVLSVLNQMLDEMNQKGVECLSPSYFSLINFGYDIFSKLHRI